MNASCPILALAGAVEMYIEQGLLICWGILSVIALLLAVALVRLSWKIAVVGLLLSAAFGAVFTPWEYLEPINDPELQDDPDIVYWDEQVCTLAKVWYLVLWASALSVPLTICLRAFRSWWRSCRQPIHLTSGAYDGNP